MPEINKVELFFWLAWILAKPSAPLELVEGGETALLLRLLVIPICKREKSAKQGKIKNQDFLKRDESKSDP